MHPPAGEQAAHEVPHYQREHVPECGSDLGHHPLHSGTVPPDTEGAETAQEGLETAHGGHLETGDVERHHRQVHRCDRHGVSDPVPPRCRWSWSPTGHARPVVPSMSTSTISFSSHLRVLEIGDVQ